MCAVYHGSEQIIESPTFGLGKQNNDFGLGFYCTESEELAKEWAVSSLRNGFVNCYSLDTKYLKILNLNSPNYTILNWIAVLVAHRLFSIKSPAAQRAKRYLIDNFGVNVNAYDLIIGYRADDSYFDFAASFLNNGISVQQLANAMRLGKLGEQIVIKSKYAFSLLHYDGFSIAEKEKYYVRRKARNDEADQLYSDILEEETDGLYSLSVLISLLLYVAGIIAQFLININKWKAAGSDYHVSPGLPSLHIIDAFTALFHFPEGLIALSIVTIGIVLLCVFGLRLGWGSRGTTDRDRNLTISSNGSYGTAAFMTDKEAAECFDITSCSKTKQDILGMTQSGQVFTLPANTRLNANMAICGASGTGKSRSVSRNLILQAARRNESVIITDCKSELYDSMSEYLRGQGYTVKVLNLIEMDHSDSWNCLGEVGSSELMAQTFSDIVLSNTTGEDHDAFWYNAELNLLKALVLYVSLEMPQDKRNFGTVYDMLVNENERSLTKRMHAIRGEHVNPFTGEVMPPSPAFAPFSLFMQSSETVRTSVIIGLGSKLQVMQAQQVKNITSYNEIDLELPGKQKCAYFCIVSDQDKTFEFLSTLFFAFLFIRLIRYADSRCEGGCLSTKVKFILDEFPNCAGSIPDFSKKASTIRSRGCSIACFFQNIGQMKNRYPDDEWQEILGACDTTIFLGCTDLLTAEYFSDRIGVSSVEIEGTMRELNTMRITNYTASYRETNSLGRRQLMTPDEILRIKPDEELVFIRGQKVWKAHRFDYSKHTEYKKLRSTKSIYHEPDWKKEAASRALSTSESNQAILHASKAEVPPVSEFVEEKPPTTNPTAAALGLKRTDINETI